MNRVLIAAKSEQARISFSRMVKEFYEHEIVYAANGKEARDIIGNMDVALLIVVAPLADEFGASLIEHASHNSCCGMILVARSGADEQALKCAESAGAITESLPVAKSLFRHAVHAACAMHNRMIRVQSETRRLQRKIEDMGIVDRAKCVLIQVLCMTEEQAHKYIEKQAMDMRVSRRQVAEELLKTYE